MRAPLRHLWLGNHPALDLANTVPLVDGAVVDLLADVGSLTAWLEGAGLAGDRPALLDDRDGAGTLGFVRRLRDALREVLDGPTRSGDDLARLNQVLADARGALHVEARADGADVSLRAEGGGATQVRLDVAAAVADLFRQDLGRVRQCDDPACRLVFLDVSKAGRRRWCDMATCGNRAKAAAHHARIRRDRPVG